jgi:hypothetical protein
MYNYQFAINPPKVEGLHHSLHSLKLRQGPIISTVQAKFLFCIAYSKPYAEMEGGLVHMRLRQTSFASRIVSSVRDALAI